MSDPDATAVDAHYREPVLAALYDAMCPWGEDDEFYACLATESSSVLDVGCGTGNFLRELRRRGHRGDLCGVDPAQAMLDVARHGDPDVEWVLGDVRRLDVGRRFELVMMTGHAFQVLVTDEDVLAALTCLGDHVEPGRGRLAFETRNPAAREWEHWAARDPEVVTVRDSRPVFVRWAVDGLDEPDLVRFHATFECADWAEPMRSDSTLRFIDPDRLAEHLIATGFAVEEWLGDWAGGPVDDRSPEVIVVARRA
jgi:SAM-dependent methyltransferase